MFFFFISLDSLIHRYKVRKGKRKNFAPLHPQMLKLSPYTHNQTHWSFYLNAFLVSFSSFICSSASSCSPDSLWPPGGRVHRFGGDLSMDWPTVESRDSRESGVLLFAAPLLSFLWPENCSRHTVHLNTLFMDLWSSFTTVSTAYFKLCMRSVVMQWWYYRMQPSASSFYLIFYRGTVLIMENTAVQYDNLC